MRMKANRLLQRLNDAFDIIKNYRSFSVIASICKCKCELNGFFPHLNEKILLEWKFDETLCLVLLGAVSCCWVPGFFSSVVYWSGQIAEQKFQRIVAIVKVRLDMIKYWNEDCCGIFKFQEIILSDGIELTCALANHIHFIGRNTLGTWKYCIDRCDGQFVSYVNC